jgi:hypothetical protein
MNIRQDIMVDSITFSGLKLGNHPIPSDMFAIDAGHTREKSKTENLRLDMWVFPFLNVYGLVGHTRGSSVSQVSVDSDPSQFRGLDRVIAGAVHQLYQSGKLQNIDFTLDFKGTTWGPALRSPAATATGLGWWILTTPAPTSISSTAAFRRSPSRRASATASVFRDRRAVPSQPVGRQHVSGRAAGV